MADLNGGKGKFWNVAEGVDYAQSFVGATKVAEKIKKGGSETTPDGFVVDAIDIDWGGLSLTTLTNNSGTLTSTQISSTEQNAGKGENTEGIHSSGYMLSKISESFKAIVDIMGANSTTGLRGTVSEHTTNISNINTTIGASDEAGLRKRIKDVETSLKALANLSPEELTRIQNDLAKIKAELEGDTTYNWATLVDKLAGLGDDTVKKYIDAQDAATLASAKTYADNKVADLDATVRGNLNENDTIASGKKVGVKVVEEDGKLKSVTVVENNIASELELTALSNTVSGHTTSIGAINDKLGGIDGTVKEYVDATAASAASTAIGHLDSSVMSNLSTTSYGGVFSYIVTSGDHVGARVVQTDGKLTEIEVFTDDIASAETLSTLQTTVDTKLAGIYGTVKDYVDATAASAASTAVDGLDAIVKSYIGESSNSKVDVIITQENGILKSVYVQDNNIASAAYVDSLGSTVNTKLAGIDNTVKDYVDTQDAATLASAESYAVGEINKLNATVDSTGGSHVAVQVVEEKGKVKTVTVTESNFDYEHITAADNKTLKETLEERDEVVATAITELDGRLDKAVQASVIEEDGENVLVLGAIS